MNKEEQAGEFDRGSVATIKEKDEVYKFDREAVLDSLEKSPLHGYKEKDLNNSSWPSLDDLEAKNNDVLKTLRLKRVEWNIPSAHAGYIASFRIKLNDGSTSH